MRAKIFCKETTLGVHDFYVQVDGQNYFLFRQDFKKSVKDFFANGVSVNEINKYSLAHSAVVRNTLDKLPIYIKYVEKEYGVAIYEKTKTPSKSRAQKGYKRQAFRWQDYGWAM